MKLQHAPSELETGHAMGITIPSRFLPAPEPYGDFGRFSEARKVLLCLRYGIGDVVMETSVLPSLRTLAPLAGISALGAHPATEIVTHAPWIDKIHTIQTWGLEHWGDRGTPGTQESIRTWFHNESFDLLVDLNHATLAVKEALEDVPGIARTDNDRQIESRALAHGRSGIDAIRASTWKGWGLQRIPLFSPSVHLHPTDHEVVTHGLQRANLPSNGFVCICPIASSHLKKYPVSKLAPVADWLVEQTSLPVIILTVPEDTDAVQLQYRMKHRAASIVMHWESIRRTAAFLTRCRLVVCNDTGIMHLAGALKVPLVALFGPTSPSIYLPRSETAEAAGGWNYPCPYRKTKAFGPPSCTICGSCLENDKGCIHRGETQEVIDAAHRLLSLSEDTSSAHQHRNTRRPET